MKSFKIVFIIIGISLSSQAFAFKQVYLDRLNETKICHHCDLRNAQLANKNFQGADLSESLLQGINLKNTNAKLAWFTHSKMMNANLEGADLSETLMDYTDLHNANLKNANLSNTQLIFSDLTNANLQGANLTGTKLRGVLFCKTIMPDGKINNSGC